MRACVCGCVCSGSILTRSCVAEFLCPFVLCLLIVVVLVCSCSTVLPHCTASTCVQQVSSAVHCPEIRACADLAPTLFSLTSCQGIYVTTCPTRWPLTTHFCCLKSVLTQTMLVEAHGKRFWPFPDNSPHASTCFRHPQVMHQLCRADYVNVKFELIQLQGQVSRVPELSLASFPQLGALLRTCPPVELTDPTADYG